MDAAALAMNLSQQLCHYKTTNDSSSQQAADSNSLYDPFFDTTATTRKAVSFPSSETHMIAVIPDPARTTPPPTQQFWYLQDELTLFRTQARDMCRHMRNFTNIRLCTLSWDSIQEDCDTRGLEQRSCLERQRRKFITNRFILQASQELSADRLAELSSKVTAWAVELAAQEAIRDFHRAYSSSTSTNIQVEENHPQLKRPISSDDEESRNLKQRSI